VIAADDVSPDEICDALHRAVQYLEESLDRRAEQNLPIAADWNTFRLEAVKIVEASDAHGRPGDLRIQASVAVL
jgi:hypothetical protein